MFKYRTMAGTPIRARCAFSRLTPIAGRTAPNGISTNSTFKIHPSLLNLSGLGRRLKRNHPFDHARDRNTVRGRIEQDRVHADAEVPQLTREMKRKMIERRAAGGIQRQSLIFVHEPARGARDINYVAILAHVRL